MSKRIIETNSENITSKIFTIRGVQVMLDSDLAKLYNVETKIFNQAVKRNIKRFPENFRFQLNEEEFENLRSQIVTSNKHGGRRYMPYVFVTKLIKNAKKSIILIDNYINETVLTNFSKNQNIEITIYTKNINKQLKLDIEKYNSQYKPIKIKLFNESHDRFMIIDEKDIYHIGASLKDLGKKWFAFSKFETSAIDMLNKLK